MNELVWEGLLEILREGQPSLKASARLWRRDDLTGSDWGGQLELPVVFRRLLPADEYHVRLPSGIEARVRVASGPSTTTMTFPTLTGIGAPPFGSQAPIAGAPAIEDDGEDFEETALPEPAPAPAPAPRSRERTPREAARAQRSPAPAPVREPAEEPAPAEAPAPEPSPAPAPAKAAAPVERPAPRAPEPKAPARPARAAARARSDRPVHTEPLQTERVHPDPIHTELLHIQSRRAAGTGREAGDSVEQTEALARAFLAAIEARQAIRPLEHQGFAGRAIAAARHDVESIATAIEVALRSRDEAGEWTEDVRNRLTSIAWFGALALPDDDSAVATAGATVTALLATLEGYLALSPASSSELRAA